MLTLAQTNSIKAGTLAIPGCKATAAVDANLLEEPVAESGNLCVYTGVEEVAGGHSSASGVLNALGEAASNPTGAAVGYEVVSNEEPAASSGQGSWAVTG
jgi:hypothetical protein